MINSWLAIILSFELIRSKISGFEPCLRCRSWNISYFISLSSLKSLSSIKDTIRSSPWNIINSLRIFQKFGRFRIQHHYTRQNILRHLRICPPICLKLECKWLSSPNIINFEAILRSQRPWVRQFSWLSLIYIHSGQRWRTIIMDLSNLRLWHCSWDINGLELSICLSIWNWIPSWDFSIVSLRI